MFDLPEAKRVRREDLYSPRSSPSPSSSDENDSTNLTNLLAAQLAQYYASPPPAPARQPIPAATVEAESEGEAEEEEEDFEFRLFSTSSGSGATKVVLENETEDLGDGAFLRGRDPRWYFADVGRRKGEFAAVAVSGEEVVAMAGRRHWGLEVPWRVMVVRSGERVVRVSVKRDGEGERVVERSVQSVEGKKKKPGKKRRILLRGRARAERDAAVKRKEEEVKRKLFDAEKEEREREKKTRRNKEKQAKRRAKEKAEKAAKRGEMGETLEEVETGDAMVVDVDEDEE